MIIDAISATGVRPGATLPEKAIASFLRFIEKRLGVSIVYDLQGVLPPDIAAPLRFADQLRAAGIVRELGKIPSFDDEPRTRSWYAVCNNDAAHQVGGTSWDSDTDALYATLAEALERYIWYTQTDYFLRPLRATEAQIASQGRYVSPRAFAGYTEEQRSHAPGRDLRDDTSYLWIQGYSLTSGKPTYVPAQTISGLRSIREQEPSIRRATTNGLATWRTRAGARLRGALELIERDAYMIMWLNQLTLPRIAMDLLTESDPDLARINAYCLRYALRPHVIQLVTDAPAYAVAVVLEDLSGHAPRFSIGLRAGRTMHDAAKKAMTEALRARRGYRTREKAGHTWDPSTPMDTIGHRERVYFWGDPSNAKHLEFMIKGEEVEPTRASWEMDTDEEHLERIVKWCRERSYECVSVTLGTSAKNPSDMSVEMVVMPELQPTYLSEETRAFGGTRWREVPEQFGYAAREKPYSDAPHPFA